MSLIDRLDEEHRTVLEALPDGLVDLSDIPAARVRLKGLLEQMLAEAPEIPGVGAEDHMAPGPSGEPDVMVRVYRPDALDGPAPALYYIHGGGMILGDVAMTDVQCRMITAQLGCVVASVEYRLAPEHPHPAPIEDCYAGLAWTISNASDLGVDPGRVAVGGASAGGGLAASLALLARDRAELDLAFQWLIYPMLDDRSATPSAHYVTHPKVWNREANIIGWQSLLGDAAGGDEVSPYAAAARATDLSGLPPAYISVGELDLFLDEDIDYAQRLLQTGVATELQVYPGAFHGSDLMVPASPISQRFASDSLRALGDALGVGASVPA